MAEQRYFEANLDTYNGNGNGNEDFLEQYEQRHQFDSEHDFEPESLVDNSGVGLKHSINHYDSSSSDGKLFVGGVSWETTEEIFNDHFSKYGEIADSVIMTDRHTGRPRGFGFVTFSDPAVADIVLSKDHTIDGRTVEVKRTVPRGDMNDKCVSRTKKVFVGGIPPSLTDDEFREYFSSFGRIIEHQIMVDYKTSRSRGFGFITFENEDSVEKIFAGGKIHELGGKQVEIKKAVPKRVTSDFTAKTYGGSGGVTAGYDRYRSGGVYDSKMGRAAATGYGVYGPYGGYGESYGGDYANFYSGYGYGHGYGYGFGYDGPMYMNARYGMNGNGILGGYGCTTGYGGVNVYGSGGDGAVNGYDNGKGSQGSGGSVPERYHPYR